MVLFFTLTGCGSVPNVPEQPEVKLHKAQKTQPPRRLKSIPMNLLKYKIVEGRSVNGYTLASRES